MKQLDQIRNHLLNHGSISSWTAIQTYRITRLSQYILLLRQEGWEIFDDWQHNETRRWVEYRLVSVPDKTGRGRLVFHLKWRDNDSST